MPDETKEGRVPEEGKAERPANRPQRNRRPSQPAQRPALSDLPPDVQAEIAGNRQASAAKRQHIYRPQIPAISQTIEIHSPEVQIAYVRFFKACNEYAVAIDYVARERLPQRASYNAYLQEFDTLISSLTDSISVQFKRYEALANGGMTEVKKPFTVDATVQSRRSLQLLKQFKSADDVLRMVTFLNIYGDLQDQTKDQVINTVLRGLERCCRGLRDVKVRCFRQIITEEDLPLRNEVAVTPETLEAVRSLPDAKARRRQRQRGANGTSSARLDPNAAAAEPLEGARTEDNAPRRRGRQQRAGQSGEAAAE